MDKVIKSILEKLENNGYIAYIIGGYVRDYLLDKKSYDIDICTNAYPSDVKRLLNLDIKESNYGNITFKIEKYTFTITTFRKEILYKNRKPIKIEYINNLDEDIIRRDFTINTIALDKNNNIIDKLDGMKDLKNKKIKLIGDSSRLKEDPLRIIRAIRFSTILDFDIDDYLKENIIINKKYVSTIPLNKIKEEIDKILMSNNVKKGFNLLKTFDLLDYIGIKYKSVVYINNLNAMWAQLELIKDYPFTKEDKKEIKIYKDIISNGSIDNYVLYKYGLKHVLVVSKIFNLKQKEIQDKYNKLAIKNRDELNITLEEINMLINDYKKSKIVEDDIIKKILNNNLKNNNNALIKYIKENYYEC